MSKPDNKFAVFNYNKLLLCSTVCLMGTFFCNSADATYYDYADIYEAFADTTQLDRGYELNSNLSMEQGVTIARQSSSQSPVFTLKGNGYGIATKTSVTGPAFNIDSSNKTLNIQNVGQGSSGNIVKSGFYDKNSTWFTNSGILNISSSAINNNSLTADGNTAIVWNGKTANLSDVHFSNNSTTLEDKGLIHNTSSGIMTINNSYFMNNSGRYLINNSQTGNTLNINNSRFSGNTAIIGNKGTLNISSSVFSNGTASELHITSGVAKLTDTDFTNNSGIYFTGGNLSIYATGKNVTVSKLNSDSSTPVYIRTTTRINIPSIRGNMDINKAETGKQYTGTVTLGGFNSEGAGKTVTIHNGTVVINEYSTIGTLRLQDSPVTFKYNATVSSDSTQDLKLENFYASGSHTLDFQNNAIQNKIELADKNDSQSGNLTLNGTITLKIDVDLATGAADYLYTATQSSLVNISGSFNLNDINLLSSTSGSTTSIKICDSVLKGHFNLGVTSISLDNNLYSISYQEKSDGGYLVFTRENEDVRDTACVRTPECSALGFTTEVNDIASLGKTAFCSPCPTNGSLYKCVKN